MSYQDGGKENCEIEIKLNGLKQKKKQKKQKKKSQIKGPSWKQLKISWWKV